MPDVIAISLRKRLGDDIFRSWFAKVTVAGVADGTVTLVAPSPFHATKIIIDYEVQLLVAWRAMDASIERVEAFASKPGIART
ncbi:hypothetical protein FNL55_05060 [Tardiphaga sp. vice352]|uniref:DnaA N-terminal domain-containing protein n=1 Tax=unclassified Tardiphaga TaxID=2631404 RepID=UPI001163A777|nr:MULTISPECIES: DnaA N-terminal domain-containing protein [unclassified Tardiphaga]QDM15433.1 hypothetical protein FNL53_05330 [Tardiphaga sp. vice278]QDM25572.1 hypothetical protein FNL56_04980 [Tardiphaga sp. vice304]QDM30781.1 hypothetical protein FNL55_05060 [Tardiphaga sp. vice352]